MKIEIYKCDYCHKDIKDPDVWREMNDLFGYDACQKCYYGFWDKLEKRLSSALLKFVGDTDFHSSILDKKCEKCGANFGNTEYVETICGRNVTAFSIPNLKLSLSFDLCDKCSDDVYPIFENIAAEMLDKYRVKYKKKNIAKLTYINELFEYSHIKKRKL